MTRIDPNINWYRQMAERGPFRVGFDDGYIVTVHRESEFTRALPDGGTALEDGYPCPLKDCTESESTETALETHIVDEHGADALFGHLLLSGIGRDEGDSDSGGDTDESV